jgi:hypothetical protein
MKLSDIEKTNSSTMNKKMRDVLGWNLNLNAMTVSSATSMMESIDNKLATVRQSHKLHESQNNPNYVGMIMAKQILESYVAEAIKKNVKESELKVKEGNKFSGELTKAKASGKEEFEVDGKKYKVTEKAQKKVDEAKQAVEPGAVATAQVKKMGKKYWTGSKLTKAGINKRDEIIRSIEADKKKKKKKVSESRLFEDELGQAQAMLAAKDMVDSMQDMIEDISKMLNEQLPPLTDSIRTAIGSAEADSFKASASSTLSSLLTTVQSSREAMDQAVRTLSGEPAAVSVPGAGAEMDMDMSEPDLGDDDLDLGDEDDFGASDAAVGGDLPMGREKR